ncbi:hypothetical protein THASP1DRAFT_32202 [Thamnocephalis sphaerospora]|uniref:Uncharacterized protein n=1 Tax=Thamnocephalis sphaerospora TaxID=78915 RepID=A0A4P9XJM2_9FUNG|nr:hypothetical protein THASP1DRAFT_32202 [Thamnocephalis sphaerospora]|eukprot:RKP05967.1 hypothetical protein THASP1DRAFT_32202 [Thamnocephalis sphaerospora]
MAIGHTVGNNVVTYPQWALITGTTVVGLFVLGHFVRFTQTRTRAHLVLSGCLICLLVQYALAIRDINAAYLTAVADIFSIIVATMLVAVWSRSMHEKISMENMAIARRTAYSWLGMFFLAVCLTLAVAIHTAITDGVPKAILVLWLVALGISIIGNLSLLVLTIWLQFKMGADDYAGKKAKRLQLSRLALLFIFLVLSKFGGLFELAVLDIIPYLLFHAQLLLTRNAISGYETEPEETAIGSGDLPTNMMDEAILYFERVSV